VRQRRTYRERAGGSESETSMSTERQTDRYRGKKTESSVARVSCIGTERGREGVRGRPR